MQVVLQTDSTEENHRDIVKLSVKGENSNFLCLTLFNNPTFDNQASLLNKTMNYNN